MRFATYFAVCAALCLCVSASAQVAYSLENASQFAGAATVYLPSAGYPSGGNDPRGSVALPEYNSIPAAGGIAADTGGFAIDQKRSTMFSCNGYFVQSEGHSLYDTPAIASSAGLGVYFPTNTITGMAIDAEQAVLYCCDGKYLRSFDVSGNPAVFIPLQGWLAPIHLSWLNTDSHLTGLGFESQTGRLWACDAQGRIYRMNTDGSPVGPQPVTTVNGAGALSGCAVNTSNGPGAINSPFCSFQVQGYHIMVSDGTNVYDAMNPLGAPLAIGSANGGGSRGLAYSSDGQLIPASSACPLNGGAVGNPNTGSGAPSGIRTTEPACSNNINALELNGGPANASARLLFDFCPVQAGGVPLPTGDTMYIWPLSPTVVIAPYATDAFGTAIFPIPLAAAPAGVQFSYQWYFNDVANPTLYGCFSDAMTVTVGLR